MATDHADSSLRLRKGITDTTAEALKLSHEEVVITKLPTRDYEKNMTALQKHSAFFDRDHDNKITVQDSYRGFRAIGFGWLMAGILASALNTGVAYPTQKNWIPGTTIYLDNIHRLAEQPH